MITEKITLTRTRGRKVPTEDKEIWDRFDAASEKMDEAFAEIDKAFKAAFK